MGEVMSRRLHCLPASKSRWGVFQVCLLALAASAATAPFVADDFHAGALDPVWTFVDPAGDGATVAITDPYTDDARLALSVPGGRPHEIWNATIGAPHVRQPLLDTDFTAEVKFSSVLPANFAQQGLLVRQDDRRWLRLEFYRTETGQLRMAAIGGPATVFLDQPLSASLPAPLLMRVTRVGDTWTLSWSGDGRAWQVVGVPFLHELQPNGLGIYAGNRGVNPPAHTVHVDWIRLSSPGGSDSARNLLRTGVIGGGVDGWSGARTGTVNPIEVTMSGPTALTATFVAVPVRSLAAGIVVGGSAILSPPATRTTTAPWPGPL